MQWTRKGIFGSLLLLIFLIAPIYGQNIHTTDLSSSVKFMESPFDKQEKDPSTIPSKLFNIKYVYYSSTVIKLNASKRNFAGAGIIVEENADFTTSGGVGVAVEFEPYKDIIFGLSGNADRTMTHVEGLIDTCTGLHFDYGYDLNSASINLSSIYVKMRHSIIELKGTSMNTYIAGKLAYNVVSKSGSSLTDFTFNNGFGYGISFGMLIYDSLDIELGFDSYSGGVKDKLLLVGTGNDAMDGSYTASNFWTSFGFRF
jgi:hypothetical protein